ncbi:MAG: hypothetical protein AAFY71_19185 [Bacteroidota bacterium]
MKLLLSSIRGFLLNRMIKNLEKNWNKIFLSILKDKYPDLNLKDFWNICQVWIDESDIDYVKSMIRSKSFSVPFQPTYHKNWVDVPNLVIIGVKLVEGDNTFNVIFCDLGERHGDLSYGRSIMWIQEIDFSFAMYLKAACE